MANQAAPVQLTVVPSAETNREIENTLDAPRRLALAIEEMKKKREAAETELTQSLGKDLAAAPLNVDAATEKHKAWKARNDALEAKIKTAEELQPVIEQRLQDLKETHGETLKAILHRKLEQLQKQAETEKAEVELIKEQIHSLQKLLADLEKPAAKNRKE